MREARKLQQGQAAQPQSRPSPRHKQPPRVRAQGCDLQEKGPERPAHPMRSALRDGKAAQSREAHRSGQLARLTEEIRAPGRSSSCCDDAAFVGGDRKQSPQQPCSRHLYNAGRIRLPGGQGLEGASHPGRRRAKARGVTGARSFRSLRNWLGNSTRNAVRTVQLVRAAAGERDHYEPVSIRYSGLLPLVDRVSREGATNSVEFSLYRGGSTCSFDQI